jgi:hypothetical protein
MSVLDTNQSYNSIIDYWSSKKDLCGIKQIFDEYFSLAFEIYSSAHASDINAWEQNYYENFVNKIHIANEKRVLKDILSTTDCTEAQEIAASYFKFIRAKQRELRYANIAPNKRIEHEFLSAYKNGGAYECMRWIRTEYDLPNVCHYDENVSEKALLRGKWKELHEFLIPEYVKEEFDDFNDGVLVYAGGGLMAEISDNLQTYRTYDDRVRYIISLLQPFKEFSEAFCPVGLIEERREAIKREEEEKVKYSEMSTDLSDDNADNINIQKQIEAIDSFITRYNKDIEHYKSVQNKFYELAQLGLTTKDESAIENHNMCVYLGRWWSLMITFAERLAALALLYGIKLMDIQKECDIYLMPSYNLTDYVDYEYISSYSHAKRLLNRIQQTPNQNGNLTEKTYAAGKVFDAWNDLSALIRSARENIILIDNYVDEQTLCLLSKRKDGVNASLYYRPRNKASETDINKFSEQYKDTQIKPLQVRVHDRYLIIDDRLFLLGSSAKDFGKGLCTFRLLDENPDEILKKISGQDEVTI